MSTFVASNEGASKNIEIIRQCGREDKASGLGELAGWLTVESSIQKQLGVGHLLRKAFQQAYAKGWAEGLQST